MNKKVYIVIVPSFVLILSSLLVYFGILNEWFGLPREGIMRYCEQARDGFIKQPSNSFSNLGFTFLGVYIFWYSFKNKVLKNNLFYKHYALPIILSVGFILTGAGSFAMHATNGYWGGFFDLFGMFFISSFLFAYGLKRWFRLKMNFFYVLFFGGVLLSSYIFLSPKLNGGNSLFSGSLIVFALFLIIGIVSELLLAFQRKININKAFGIISLALLIVAFTIWNLSLDMNSLWCNPNSFIQGHAVWHLLDALGGYFLFHFYVSEKLN